MDNIKNISVSFHDFKILLMKDLMGALIKNKEMIIINSNDQIEVARSSWRNKELYEFEFYKLKDCIRLKLYIRSENSDDIHFRQVEITSDELAQDVIMKGRSNIVEFYESMYQTLRNIDEERWKELCEKCNSKVKV